RAGAAGVTFGSETSGGIRNVQVLGGRVLAGVPVGILFKSASTRGGAIDDIRIEDMIMEGVGTVFSVAFNWNPSYSYAKIPEGMKNVPEYWRVLAEPVPPEKGLPHLQNVVVAHIRATGARQAFSVVSYKDSPLRNFHFDDLRIEARSAGSIQNAEDWMFSKTEIHSADGSHVVVKDSTGVTGLP
ncbi:MAG: glycoside hydrolase family 28 protein, partial [Bryobacteraceae bacterium]